MQNPRSYTAGMYAPSIRTLRIADKVALVDLGAKVLPSKA